MNPVKTAAENPNAVVGGTSGVGGGAAVIYLLSLVGITVSGYGAVLIAGAITTVFLFVGKHGIRGFLRMIWRGSGT